MNDDHASIAGVAEEQFTSHTAKQKKRSAAQNSFLAYIFLMKPPEGFVMKVL